MKLATQTSVLALASIFFVGFHLSSANAQSAATETVKDVVSFPGFGPVTADKVCVTADGETLRTVVPARSSRACVADDTNRTDPENPISRCRRWRVITVPERVIEAPVALVEEACVKYELKRPKNGFPVWDCTEVEAITVRQNLEYRVEIFEQNDTEKKYPRIETRTIGACQG